MLGQIVGAQFDLERCIAELPVAARTESELQLQALRQLQRQIGQANPAALGSMRAEISAAIAVARAAATQGRTTATVESAAMLAEAASASRQQVTALMQDMHRFGPLHFASPEDQEAYRRHEAERRAYVEAEQAKGTPQGDLNASAGAIGQMVDAHAHGAGSSPEFQQRWNELVATTEKLRDAIIRNGGSTAEFDQRLRDDLRAILKGKGLSDAQIDARLAAHPDNPLQAMRAYVGDSDFDTLDRTVQRAQEQALEARSPIVVAASPIRPELGMDDALAKLQAAGITANDHTADEPFAHGVDAAREKSPSRSAGV